MNVDYDRDCFGGCAGILGFELRGKHVSGHEGIRAKHDPGTLFSTTENPRTAYVRCVFLLPSSDKRSFFQHSA